jgi:hypothetical protein
LDVQGGFLGDSGCHITISSGMMSLVEEVFYNPIGHDFSRSSGLPILFGFAPDGRYILVVYAQIDDITIYPVTAYIVEQ